MTNKTPLRDIATYMADSHASDPLIAAAGPSADDVAEFDLCALRDSLNEGGWDGDDEALQRRLRLHLRAALQAEAEAWAEAQEEKAAAARIEAALNILKEASSGQARRYETWAFADDDDLDALGAAVLAGAADAYSLWCAQYGEELETPREMPAETAVLEAEVRGLT